MGVQVDLREELEAAPMAGSHRFLVFILALAMLFDGYDLFVPAYVIPYALKEWQLVPSEAGLLVSAGLIGFMLGSLLNGVLADRIGRKPPLVGALLFAAFLNFATAEWAHSFGSFLLMRALTGISLGMLLPLSMTLINEMAPRRARNWLVGWVMVGWSLGGVLAALLAAWLISDLGWRILFDIGAASAPIVALLALWRLPESPRLLAVKGHSARLQKAMSWLIPTRAHLYGTASFSLVEANAGRSSMRALLAADVRGTTLIFWACSSCSLFAIFGLASWTPQLMIERGESAASSFLFGALLQLMSLLGALGCGWISDRIGGRRLLPFAWLLSASALGALALINGHVWNVLLIALAGFCIFGGQPVLTNLTAAFYPTEARSTGVGAQLGVGRLGGILGPYVGGWIQQLAPGSAALWLFMSGLLLVSAFAISRVGPIGLMPAHEPALPATH